MSLSLFFISHKKVHLISFIDELDLSFIDANQFDQIVAFDIADNTSPVRQVLHHNFHKFEFV